MIGMISFRIQTYGCIYYIYIHNYVHDIDIYIYNYTCCQEWFHLERSKMELSKVSR